MTISSLTSRNDYTGNGALATYSYTFKIFSESDLLVTKETNDSPAVVTTLVLNTDYTVTGVGETAGGTIVLTAGNLTSGYLLTIRRVGVLKQLTDIRNQGDYYPETHEDQFDKFIIIDQQQQDQIDRSLKTSETDYTDELILPTVADRASKYLAFDADGLPIASSASADSVAITPYMETLLDDTTAAAARTTLGFAGSGGTAQAANIEDAAITAAKLGTGSVIPAKLLAGTAGKWNYLTKSANFTCTYGDFISCDDSGGGFNITLPTAVGATGQMIGVKKSSAGLNVVTVVGTVNGSTNYHIVGVNEAAVFISNGTTWDTLSSRTSYQSCVMVYGGSGFGSTNTTVRRFTTISQEGGAIDYVASATNGDTFTILKDGLYQLNYNDMIQDSTNWRAGITLNATGADLTSNIESISTSKVIAAMYVGDGDDTWGGSCQVIMKLNRNDVIRCQGLNTVNFSTNNFTVRFSIGLISGI